MKKLFSLLMVAVSVTLLAACGTGNDLPPEILDCIENPSAEGCDPTDIIDPTDERSAEEILAAAIVDNWDGELTHLSVLMDNMDFESSMELETELNLEVLAEDNVTHQVNILIVDNYDYSDMTTIHRFVTLNFDGEMFEFEILMEEVATGVRVYFNTDYIRAMLAEDGDTEVLEVLDTLGATEDWFMFKFDDSLANLIELEVLKDLLVDAFFSEVGDTFFYSLQDELELELEFDFGLYNVDLGLFVDHLVAEDFTAAEAMIDAVLWEDMVFDLDAEFLVPELVLALNEENSNILLVDPLFVVADHVAFLEANGTEAWLNDLTDAEIVTLLEVFTDAETAEVYAQYAAGTLDHYIVMMFLDDVEVEAGLRDIPGFDFDLFKANMDMLDYDAFYDEVVDGDALAQAVYDGQVAFDAYVLALAATAPQSAKVLAPWSGFVLFLEDFMVIVDDVEYGLDSLVNFEEYFTMDYYLDNNIMNMEVVATDDFAIETIMTMGGTAYANLFVDVAADVYWYLDGFESFELPYLQFINCPAGEVCEDFSEYTEIMSGLAQMGDMEIVALYDPSNPTEMTMTVQFADFANAIIEMEEESGDQVIDMSITVTQREEGMVTVPTQVTDVNMVAEDFARFSLVLLAYEYMEDTGNYYNDNALDFPALNTQVSLDMFDGYVDPTYAFDANMSYVKVTGDILNPDYEIQLYWMDGTPVFTEALTWSLLETVIGAGTGAPDAADYQMYLTKINEDNFNMTKLFLVYLLDEDNMEDNYDDEYVEEYPEY